ncbi:hypothetical protein ATH84_103119 [Paracoccus versutus]|uniref:Acylphosphatase n=1 Tax=Paracoccus versutus TaxID=34007 RepID=A0AAQ0KK76_PARVE|nr:MULTISPECIES: hypothetical protein [Paracoccus]KGJ07440.1 hypothetical protein IT40_20920 [Paracoccus versutus]KRW97746.1 hypothetical protein AQY21_01890 [Paracoccus sp. MKU1]REG38386.1 hypothetical protein ATH84_103119 [Paracoccus versutus]
MVTRRVSLEGALKTESCLAMVSHFARRLSLSSTITSATPKYITLILTGDESLIDMFEIACWLGPDDVNIDTITLETV